MNDPSERIHAALLRYQAAKPAAGDRKIRPAEPQELARQFVVVNEQNLAALWLSSLGRAYPNGPNEKQTNTEG